MKKSTWRTKLKRTSKLAHIARQTWKLRHATEENRDVARQALTALLADARGIPMKIGQILATTSGEEAYQPLCEGIEPWPLERMLPVLEESLGFPIEQEFSVLEPSKAAASLGQVHKAKHHDGRSMAIKIQYPDIASAIDAELGLMGLLPGLGPAKKWGFQLEQYKRDIHQGLHKELDYLHEAKTQVEFGEKIKVDGLKVPKVYLEWCTKQILVQEWVEGVRLEATKEWSKRDRLLLGKTLLQTIFQSIFVHGMVHGDPHSGNYFFGHDQENKPEVILLDFGSVLDIGKRPALALLKLLTLARERRNEDPLPYFVELGYNPDKLIHIHKKLPALCMLLFRPFLEDRVLHLQDWELGEEICQLLGEQRWWFRSAATPLQLFLVRTFQGLLVQLESLGVGLPWWPLLEHTLSQDTFEEALALEPKKVETIPNKGPTFADFSSLLRVEITEEGRKTKDLSIPSAEIISLRELIPEDIQRLLEKEGTDIEQIERDAQAAKTFPFELFKMRKEKRLYRVWLE